MTNMGRKQTVRLDVVVEEYKNGASISECSKKHGMSKISVRAAIKRRGVKIEPRPWVQTGCLRDPKYEGIKEIYESGKTVKELAILMGVCCNRMIEVLKGRGAKIRGDRLRGYKCHLYRDGSRFSNKGIAKKVRRAIRSGRLIKQPCVVCGSEKSFGHHCDYNKPLDLVWLCDKHHYEWHKNNRPIGITK